MHRRRARRSTGDRTLVDDGPRQGEQHPPCDRPRSCRRWPASDEAVESGADYSDAIASKPAPTAKLQHDDRRRAFCRCRPHTVRRLVRASRTCKGHVQPAGVGLGQAHRPALLQNRQTSLLSVPRPVAAGPHPRARQRALSAPRAQVTALLSTTMELAAWLITAPWLSPDYRTYRQTVESEIKAALRKDEAKVLAQSVSAASSLVNRANENSRGSPPSTA